MSVTPSLYLQELRIILSITDLKIPLQVPGITEMLAACTFSQNALIMSNENY